MQRVIPGQIWTYRHPRGGLEKWIVEEVDSNWRSAKIRCIKTDVPGRLNSRNDNYALIYFNSSYNWELASHAPGDFTPWLDACSPLKK